MKALEFTVDPARFIAAKALRALFGNRVFYSGPVKTIGLKEIPEPALPSPEWVKVRTIYCGFCGSDLNMILLHDSPTASPFTSFPCIMGHEIVGEIIETGSDVVGFAPGDRVAIAPALGCETRQIADLCPACESGRSSNCENFAEGRLPPGMFLGINRGLNGGFAPVVAAHMSQLFKVPGELSPEAAVMTEPAAVALQAVFENMPEPGEKVLVVGGGVIGNLIVQSIRALVPDSHLSVVEPSAFAASMARKMGADEIISPGDIIGRTERITGARSYKPMIGKKILMGGFGRIYDTVASASTLNTSMRALAVRGTLSVVGIGADVKLDLTPLWLKLQTVKGVYAYGVVAHNGSKRHIFEIALELMEKNRIAAEELVTHKFNIDDYREMIAVNLDKEKHQAMKTVVSFAE